MSAGLLETVVLSVLLLAQILDGASMTEDRLELWERVGIAIADDAAGSGKARLLPEEQLEGVAAAFRHRKLISAEMIEKAIDGRTPPGEMFAEKGREKAWRRVRGLLLVS